MSTSFLALKIYSNESIRALVSHQQLKTVGEGPDEVPLNVRTIPAYCLDVVKVRKSVLWSLLINIIIYSTSTPIRNNLVHAKEIINGATFIMT